jgi:hypothetical protein
VISVDTKKKELVGRYAQAGREWHPQGEPVEVSTYDFSSQADGCRRSSNSLVGGFGVHVIPYRSFT